MKMEIKGKIITKEVYKKKRKRGRYVVGLVVHNPGTTMSGRRQKKIN